VSRGCDAGSIVTWSRRAKPGVTSDERDEPVRLRRENRVLRMERDLLSRAAALLATENVLPRK